MTSKYRASIKVRLTRVFNIAVILASTILVGLIALVFYKFEINLIKMTIDELKLDVKESMQISQLEKGSEISDRF